jgi:uncharacterized protein with beta-barrel porin domain
MRIEAGRRRQVGVAVGALVPFLALAPAQGADLTVNNSRNTTVNTGNADGTGPGNVTVQSGGTVSVSDPVAITLDSSNTVSNAGNVATSAESNAAGIGALTTLNGAPQFLTGGITNTGTITVSGPASGSSLYNTDVFNAGIRLQGLGSFSGAVGNSGTISVGGQSSYGVWINAPMIGDLTNSGTITMVGTNAAGIFTTAPITGSIVNSGTISGTGTGSIGIYIGNTVTGGIQHSGTISVGNAATIDASGNTVAPNSATAGIWLAGSVTQGLYLSGNGYTKAQEAADTSISTTGESTITSVGNGPGILVAPGGSGGFRNVVIGKRSENPYGIVNLGNIIVGASQDGVNAVGVDVRGATDANGLAYTAKLDGGFLNSGGNINVTAINGTATGFHVGGGGIVPELKNTGDILVTTIDNTADNSRGLVGTKGGTAYGVVVEQGGTLSSFTNTGNLTITSQGPNSSFGVLDRSGTLFSFLNSGKITPIIDKLSTGAITAVDLRANTTGVNFANNGTITGPVYLGSGNNTYTMNAGTQTGNVSFVGGTTAVSLTGSTIQGNVDLGASTGASTVALANSTINGGLSSTTGGITLTATQNSNLNIPTTQQLKVANASFDSTSTLSLGLTGGTSGNAVLTATGNVSFANGAKITPVFDGIIQSPQTVTLVSAGNLSLGGTVANLVTPNVSYLNSYTSQIDPANRNALIITARRRTAGEMGLDANTAAALNGAIGALTKDTAVATAISAPATREGFLAAFQQLTPDTSDATRQIALAAQDLSLGAVRRRLSGIPDLRPGAAGDRSSFWLQALANTADAKPVGDNRGYSFWGVGIALGVDTAVSPTTKVGVSFTEMFDSVDFGVSPNSTLFIYGSHLNLYARQDLGRFYLQGLVGGGLNRYEGTRNITIGTFRRTAEGIGNGYQVGGTVELGTKIGLGTYNLDPYVRASWLKLKQGNYQDTGGGDGVNLTVDSHSQTSLKGSTGFTVGRNFTLGYDTMLEAQARGNYSHEFKNLSDVFSSHFTADSTPFTNSILMHGPDYFSAGFSIGHKDSFSSITLDYDGEAAGKYTAHTATVTLRFRL